MKKTFAKLRQILPTATLMTASIATAMVLSVPAAQAKNNPAPTLKADAPNRYEVKKGDTLWGISGRYLKSPEQWRKIWAANKQVKNPHLIYPGDILLMCIIQGETLIGIDTGEGCAGIERDMQTSAPADMASSAVPSRVTITSLNNSIPPIPLSSLETWLDRMMIVRPEDFAATPYVLASRTRNLVTGQGDTIYAKGVPLVVGQRYGVFREEAPYIQASTQANIGLEVRQVASGMVTDVAPNGVSTIDLLKSYDFEVREGDRVFIEIDNNVPPVFYPKPASVDRGGQVLRVMDSISNAANGSVISINLGTNNGAEPGDVLAIYQRGDLVRDVKDDDAPVRLPSEKVGHVMIFNSFDDISYAYVLDTKLPIRVGDRLMTPPML